MREHPSPVPNGTSVPDYGSPAAPHGASTFAMGPVIMPPSRISVSIDWQAVQAALTLALLGATPQNMTSAGPALSAPPAVPHFARSAELWPHASTINGDTSFAQQGPGRVQPPVKERNGVLLLPREVPASDSDTLQSVGAGQSRQRGGQPDAPAQSHVQPTAFARQGAEGSTASHADARNVRPSSQRAQSQHESPLTDEETGRNLPIETGEAKIRGHELYTNWYSTNAKHPIRAPRAGLHVEHGYLYLHRARKGGLRMWMWFDDEQCPRLSDERTTSSESGRWERVQTGHAHPSLEKHSLHVLEGDRPRWAGKEAVRSYQKKMRMKERMKTAF